jgi:cell division transport system permease protein
METIKKDVTMVIFLDSDTTEEQRKSIESSINATGNVEKLTYKSKQDYADEFAQENETLKTIIDGWTDDTNPLLDSFELKVKDIEDIKQTATTIKKLEHVNSVKYSEDTVEQLATMFSAIEKGCIVAVIALILVTGFLIANTIKLAIYSRKREIEIMRLVGASNISIKVPFIIEGLFLGIIGSIIPIILTIYGYISIYDFFGGKISTFAKLIEPTPFVYLSSILLLIIGILVGMFGSYQAVKKYLKV